LLFSTPEPVQRWFAREGLPAMVVGSSPAGLKLASVDVDFRAVGRHAAGVMLSRGHRELAIFMPEVAMPGDVACREGFRDYVASRRVDRVNVIEMTAPTQSAQFRTRLDEWFRSRSRATAVFSMRPANTLAFYVHALEAGLRVPRDVSLVSRDTHPMLEAALPELARYGTSTLKLAARVVRLVSHLLAGRHVPSKPSLATPEFVSGKTLAAPRAAAAGGVNGRDKT
jgi:DNA-binding LacI/PurR family transcriptional regulator